MSRDWESTLRAWAKPPSQSERERCANAESMVRKAVRASDALAEHEVEVFLQGSYRNNTNVRAESDVDVCVRCMDVFWASHPFDPSLTDSEMGIRDDPTGYTFPQFKSDVEAALRRHFGRAGVSRGDKAIHVSENSYRVEADVVAAFEQRRYQRFSSGTVDYFSGTAFVTDAGKRIQNWPHQHYENGVEKNKATGQRFKAMVRALKSLHNEMVEHDAVQLPSFLLESLVWNVPTELFGSSEYSRDLFNVLEWLRAGLASDEGCNDWVEVNDLKYLFRGGAQPWSRPDAELFVGQAWHYLRITGASQ